MPSKYGTLVRELEILIDCQDCPFRRHSGCERSLLPFDLLLIVRYFTANCW